MIYIFTFITLVHPTQTVTAINAGGFSIGNLTWALEAGNSTIATNAASRWNNVSSKVTLSRSQTKGQYGYTANIVAFIDSHAAPSSTALGVAQYFKTWGLSPQRATVSERRVKTIIYQYKNPKLDTTIKKTATATHEFGHALSLKDVTAGTDSIMVQ